MVAVTEWPSLRDEWPEMTDEDITVRTGDVTCLRTAELEHVIERLVVIAEDQGRGFLAYLLAMALEHLREEGHGSPRAPH
jgi:GNAT superfamily N-acetyltransferase